MKKYYINQNIKSANISNVFRNGLKNSVLNLADFRAAVNNIAGKTLTACEINHLLGTSCAFCDKVKNFAEEIIMDKYKEACEAAERGEPQFDEEGFPLEGSKAWFDESRNELLEMGWW